MTRDVWSEEDASYARRRILRSYPRLVLTLLVCNSFQLAIPLKLDGWSRVVEGCSVYGAAVIAVVWLTCASEPVPGSGSIREYPAKTRAMVLSVIQVLISLACVLQWEN